MFGKFEDGIATGRPFSRCAIISVDVIVVAAVIIGIVVVAAAVVGVAVVTVC